MHKPVDTACG